MRPDTSPRAANGNPTRAQSGLAVRQGVSALAFPLGLTGAMGLSLGLPALGAAPELALLAVLVLLGVDDETLITFSAVSISVAAFQHANARLSLGPLNHVFSTHELHRWHHDSRTARSQVNFGSVLSIWDRVFGSFHNREAEQPGRPGLDAASAEQVPKDRYWAQVFGPLRRFGSYAAAADKASP